MKIWLIINVILIICELILFFNINLKIEKKNSIQKQLFLEISSLNEEKEKIIKNNAILKKQLEQQLQIIKYQKQQLFQQQRQKKYKQLQKWEQQQRKEIQTKIENEKNLSNQIIQHNNQLQKQTIKKINYELESYKKEIEKEKQQLNNEIEKLKTSLIAGTKAKIREQQKKEKINFYKMSISETDLEDVKKLEALKHSFYKPVVLSKLIWSQYFQKKMTELCDRVLGKDVVTGIYKITNLITEQCYIGQSINVSTRFKQHCKCGLGIDASTTNALYNSMQKDGVWNFSFELLEKCPKQELNEKEAFWIETYQSNIYGLNSNKGIKK